MNTTQSNDTTGFRQNTHGLREDVGVVAGDLRSMACDTMQAAKSGVAELNDTAHRAMEAAKVRLHDASKVASNAAGTITDTIVKNPVTSLAIAAGAGLVIGLLLLRSHR